MKASFAKLHKNSIKGMIAVSWKTICVLIKFVLCQRYHMRKNESDLILIQCFDTVSVPILISNQSVPKTTS